MLLHLCSSFPVYPVTRKLLNDACVYLLNHALQLMKVLGMVFIRPRVESRTLMCKLRRKQITDVRDHLQNMSEDNVMLRLTVMCLDVYLGRTVTVVLLPTYCYFVR